MLLPHDEGCISTLDGTVAGVQLLRNFGGVATNVERKAIARTIAGRRDQQGRLQPAEKQKQAVLATTA